MKPSEPAAELESEDADVEVMKDHHALICLALRHHEALVDTLEDIVYVTKDVDPLPFCLQRARNLLATIEREASDEAAK